MKWVGQRGKHDCGIAAVAMAFGIEYDEANAAVGDALRQLQATRPISGKELKFRLQEKPQEEFFSGLQILAARKNKQVRLLFNAEDCPDDQTVKPGKAYLVSVKSDYETGLHAVAIDKDGTVFDPYNEALRPHFSLCLIDRVNYEITDVPPKS